MYNFDREILFVCCCQFWTDGVIDCELAKEFEGYPS
jgi:hypothetical protein